MYQILNISSKNEHNPITYPILIPEYAKICKIQTELFGHETRFWNNETIKIIKPMFNNDFKLIINLTNIIQT